VAQVYFWGPYYITLSLPGLLPGSFYKIGFKTWVPAGNQGTWTVTAHPRAGTQPQIMHSDMSVQTRDIGEELNESYETVFWATFGNSGAVPIHRFAVYLSQVYL
jgi:hypothetical protein